MTIAFVSDSIYPYHKGGKEKRLYELSTRLSAMGHDVHIYTMHWWKTPEKVRTEDGVQLHAISKYRNMYKSNRRSTKASILFGLACLKLWRVQFDILDVDHMPYFPVFSMWLICAVRRRKMYGTWHEALTYKDWTDYMGKSGHIAYIVERLSIKLPYRITSSSSHTKFLLNSVHGRDERVDLVTPGVDMQLIKSIKPASIRCDVLYIGRLVKDKNVDKLIRAIHILIVDKPNIRCVIVGHGIEKTRLAKLITKLKLSKNVSLLDSLSLAEDVYAYMKATKVFCLPSVREGFGMVALEALACGTPVITTNSPANAAKSLISEGKNGSLVEPTPDLLAQAISKWLEEQPKAEIISKLAAEYDWNTLAKKQEEVYAL